jgi:hypothetical protein
MGIVINNHLINNVNLLRTCKNAPLCLLRVRCSAVHPVRQSERLRRCLFLSTASYLTLATQYHAKDFFVEFICLFQQFHKIFAFRFFYKNMRHNYHDNQRHDKDCCQYLVSVILSCLK